MNNPIIVEVIVSAPIQKVWEYWTKPEHIIKWNFASEDWFCPKAENDLRNGGKFNIRMESKDGKVGFDFEGVYDEVIEDKKITYNMSGGTPQESTGRRVEVTFEETTNGVMVKEVFDPETENPVEMQREGWQAILNNFKKAVEA